MPKRKKSFYKFWWCQELDILKDNCIASCIAWRSANKPRQGPIFLQYRKDKLQYKKRLKEEQYKETQSYSNDLHDALLRKSGQDFWKTWKSKFNKTSVRTPQIDGCSDNGIITNKFAEYFEVSCTPFNQIKNEEWKSKYDQVRSDYHGCPVTENNLFDVELVSKLMSNMTNGKAAGLDEITSEHLKFSHPIVVVILTKLFNIYIDKSHLPIAFGASYSIPIPKKVGYSRGLSVDDFRCISISPVISKLFELAILDRFSSYLLTSDHQFGFKKHLGTNHAIYCVRNIIESFINNGSTVNICSLDLSKAFDRVNHYALYVKLMERYIPTELLSVLEQWFSIAVTCVKFNGHVSKFFSLRAGVRQGGVLSPALFAIFIDDIITKVKEANVGCYFSSICASILIYADDILLISPTVSGLQCLLTICEQEIIDLDMRINVSKSMCIRFGPGFNTHCADLYSIGGGNFSWVSSCWYLGVQLVSGRMFKCSFSEAKAKFFRAFNAVFGKVGRTTNEDIVITLLKAKCLPILLYATEACLVQSRDRQSLEFAVTRAFMKIFKTGSSVFVADCQRNFNFLSIKHQLNIRTANFLQRFSASENTVCSVFSLQATFQLRGLFKAYGDGIQSARQLSNALYELNCLT